MNELRRLRNVRSWNLPKSKGRFYCLGLQKVPLGRDVFFDVGHNFKTVTAFHISISEVNVVKNYISFSICVMLLTGHSCFN